jgi:hypothetical protein
MNFFLVFSGWMLIFHIDDLFCHLYEASVGRKTGIRFPPPTMCNEVFYEEEMQSDVVSDSRITACPYGRPDRHLQFPGIFKTRCFGTPAAIAGQ